MLDIKFIRENADVLRDVSTKKNLDPKVIDELIEVDAKRRELMTAWANYCEPKASSNVVPMKRKAE